MMQWRMSMTRRSRPAEWSGGRITLSRAGLSVLVLEANSTIGAARVRELTLPDSFTTFARRFIRWQPDSPFFKTLPLERFGLSWIEPEIPLAHPLDNEPRPVFIAMSM